MKINFPVVTKWTMFDVLNEELLLAPLLVSDRRVRANIAVKEFVEKTALIILVMRL